MPPSLAWLSHRLGSAAADLVRTNEGRRRLPGPCDEKPEGENPTGRGPALAAAHATPGPRGDRLCEPQFTARAGSCQLFERRSRCPWRRTAKKSRKPEPRGHRNLVAAPGIQLANAHDGDYGNATERHAARSRERRRPARPLGGRDHGHGRLPREPRPCTPARDLQRAAFPDAPRSGRPRGGMTAVVLTPC